MPQNPPPGMAQIIPYLYYQDADAAIEFMVESFGFTIDHAFRNPDNGKVLTAQLRTGSGVIFVGPGMEYFGTRGTPDRDHVSCMIYVFVDDVDEHYARVCSSEAEIREEPHAHFGDNRQYTVSDPGGQRWTFASPLEVVEAAAG